MASEEFLRNVISQISTDVLNCLKDSTKKYYSEKIDNSDVKDFFSIIITVIVHVLHRNLYFFCIALDLDKEKLINDICKEMKKEFIKNIEKITKKVKLY